MKSFKTILLLFISLNIFGQTPDKTLVYGTVTSTVKNFDLFSYTGICVNEYKSDGHYTLYHFSVDTSGYFRRLLPKNTKLDLRTNYKNFFDSNITINTGSRDSLILNFNIYPKEYIYTEKSAEKDIANGIIQLIMFDCLIYDWNQKINFTKEFGFNYLFLSEYPDSEFGVNMQLYNLRMFEYLYTQDSTWYERLSIIEDSLINLDADNYGKENEINLLEIKFPENIRLPRKMIEVIDEQKSGFNRIFRRYRDSIIDYSPEYILDKIDNDSNYRYIFVAEYWMAFNYMTMIPELIKRLTDNKEVGLSNTNSLIIWERIQSGDLSYYGEGGVAYDDLFKVAGRANHLLRRITGEDFGSVSMYSTSQDLKKLQNRWAYWLMNINKNK